MIRRIRHRFIRIALLVLALAMVLVAVTSTAANWISVRAELAETLEALSQSQAEGRQGASAPVPPVRGHGRTRRLFLFRPCLLFTLLLYWKQYFTGK